jgi:hypothetical protein
MAGPKPRRYRDDRPYGYGPDMFEPNNMPNHRGLGHEVPPNNRAAWILLVAIIALALVLA